MPTWTFPVPCLQKLVCSMPAQENNKCSWIIRYSCSREWLHVDTEFDTCLSFYLDVGVVQLQSFVSIWQGITEAFCPQVREAAIPVVSSNEWIPCYGFSVEGDSLVIIFLCGENKPQRQCASCKSARIYECFPVQLDLKSCEDVSTRSGTRVYLAVIWSASSYSSVCEAGLRLRTWQHIRNYVGVTTRENNNKLIDFEQHNFEPNIWFTSDLQPSFDIQQKQVGSFPHSTASQNGSYWDWNQFIYFWKSRWPFLSILLPFASIHRRGYPQFYCDSGLSFRQHDRCPPCWIHVVCTENCLCGWDGSTASRQDTPNKCSTWKIYGKYIWKGWTRSFFASKEIWPHTPQPEIMFRTLFPSNHLWIWKRVNIAVCVLSDRSLQPGLVNYINQNKVYLRYQNCAWSCAKQHGPSLKPAIVTWETINATCDWFVATPFFNFMETLFQFY